MRAGTLNKRATFKKPTRTQDATGGWVTTLSDYITVWAQLSPERAREKIQQGRIANASAGALRIRSSTQTRQIDGTFVVVVDGVTYNVRGSANPDQRNDMLEIIVETDGTSAGAN